MLSRQDAESLFMSTYKLISFQDKEKPMAVRNANIMAARGMPYTSFTEGAAEIQQLLQMP